MRSPERHDANGASAQNPGIAKYADSVLKLKSWSGQQKIARLPSVHGSGGYYDFRFWPAIYVFTVVQFIPIPVPSGATTARPVFTTICLPSTCAPKPKYFLIVVHSVFYRFGTEPFNGRFFVKYFYWFACFCVDCFCGKHASHQSRTPISNSLSPIDFSPREIDSGMFWFLGMT